MSSFGATPKLKKHTKSIFDSNNSMKNCMDCHLHLKDKECDCTLSRTLLEKDISSVTNFTYLDVVFDTFMAWKAHADYACKKVATRVSILELIRGFVTTKAVVLVSNTNSPDF